jgi:NAD(P)-dependent dehydrogenase (short-subunit alcohol dehydrogenase family)
LDRRRPAGRAWSAADIPSQAGRTAVVTGASSGVGLETATELARRGATVVLACRDGAKAEAAAGRIRAAAPGAAVEPQLLDLASLRSVRAAADRLLRERPRLDLLVNNAGVMAPPRALTEDGFELQLGVNHLGHFALTGLLLRALLATPGSRVVTVASRAHRRGRIAFDDLRSERGYVPKAAYAQSKLANLLFTFELQRRLAAAGAPAIALAAHPGWARTELQRHVAAAPAKRAVLAAAGAVLAQSAARGALPILRAATDPDAAGGDYFGPSGWKESKGDAVRVAASEAARDPAAQARLWEVSEALTGVGWPRG